MCLLNTAQYLLRVTRVTVARRKRRSVFEYILQSFNYYRRLEQHGRRVSIVCSVRGLFDFREVFLFFLRLRSGLKRNARALFLNIFFTIAAHTY